jgi:hypothetical protein
MTAMQLVSRDVQQTQAAAVTITSSLVGAHVGIRYRADDSGNLKHAHLAFHHEFKIEESIDHDVCWVIPSLSEDELSDVATSARLVARRYADGRMPYAYGLDGQYLNENDGSLMLGNRLGLTCSTFLILLFRHARVELVETSSWDERSPARREEDVRAHETLLKHLRNRDADHARKVEAQGVDATRIRAEEVAAASGLSPHPVPFALAEPAGQALLIQL